MRLDEAFQGEGSAWKKASRMEMAGVSPDRETVEARQMRGRRGREGGVCQSTELI